MSISFVEHVQNVKGIIEMPGDKSISHRSIIFGSIANGKTYIHNFLKSEDCYRTIDCFRNLGVEIEEHNHHIIIESEGFASFKEPETVIYTGNSGTTSRLMLGVLAGTPFFSCLNGDLSMNNRPMSRVVKPLQLMGGTFLGRKDNEYLPMCIMGSKLTGIDYTLPVASAQVKSALILASLHAEGNSSITEPLQTRDHTERMLVNFGGEIEKAGNVIKVPGNQSLYATEIQIPGDFSSAAFFIALALLAKNSDLIVKDVSLNPTRTGFLDIIKLMNGKIEFIEKELRNGEEFGSIRISSSDLTGTTIEGELIPRTIDELPIVALLATQASGITTIKNAEELKVKESNRIEAVVSELRKLGANIEATHDGMIIEGKSRLTGGIVTSYNDHRIGMMLSIAGLLCEETVVLDNHECVSISYPNFYKDLNRLITRLSY